jgi:hypothetical protein
MNLSITVFAVGTQYATSISFSSDLSVERVRIQVGSRILTETDHSEREAAFQAIGRQGLSHMVSWLLEHALCVAVISVVGILYQIDAATRLELDSPRQMSLGPDGHGQQILKA